MSVPSINIGICGLGTVGQGVWKHINANRFHIDPNAARRDAIKHEQAPDRMHGIANRFQIVIRQDHP